MALHDPYRVLGLARGASIDDIKRAYRRLAKQLHPDSGGERTLARFLEIQAAYEQLLNGAAPARGARPGRATGARAPWQADPSRADATRRAYGARTRRTGTRPGESAGGEGTGSERTEARPREDGASTEDGKRRGRRKATLGSTSYDEAADQPFDPDWTGSSWYGTTSGTYWTLNPREYADPRKHGPEYQARARRAAGEPIDPNEPGEPPAAGPAEPAEQAEQAEPGATEPTPTEVARDAGPGWRPAAETSTGTEWSATPGSMRQPPAGGPGGASGAGTWPGERRPPRTAEARTGGPGAPMADITRLLDPRSPRSPLARLVLAVAGGVPVALWLSWLLGELSGCGRFAATCEPGVIALAWVAGVALVVTLALVPPLASILVTGAAGAVVAGIPATVFLTATGGARMPEESAAVLGIALVVGWLTGVVLATNRWLRHSGRPGPVS